MGGIWFVSYFAGYENPNLPGIKSFTALPEGATYTSLGHRPRYARRRLGTQSTALASLNSPLQGCAFFALLPRALPWAILFCPFRANAIAKQEFNFARALVNLV